jgi:predicted nucleic acid-binding protein
VSRAVFVDTSGWLAAANPRETHHLEAAAAYDNLVSARIRLVTTNLVVAEMHILVVREQGSRAGCALLDAIYTDPRYTVVSTTRDLESAATDRWLRPFQDHRFSLTDAVSFEVMRVEGITEALALDNHFEVAGYTLLPAPPKRSRAKPRSRR